MLVRALCPRGSTVGWSDLCSCHCVSFNVPLGVEARSLLPPSLSTIYFSLLKSAFHFAILTAEDVSGFITVPQKNTAYPPTKLSTIILSGRIAV